MTDDNIIVDNVSAAKLRYRTFYRYPTIVLQYSYYDLQIRWYDFFSWFNIVKTIWWDPKIGCCHAPRFIKIT